MTIEYISFQVTALTILILVVMFVQFRWTSKAMIKHITEVYHNGRVINDKINYIQTEQHFQIKRLENLLQQIRKTQLGKTRKNLSKIFAFRQFTQFWNRIESGIDIE